MYSSLRPLQTMVWLLAASGVLAGLLAGGTCGRASAADVHWDSAFGPGEATFGRQSEDPGAGGLRVLHGALLDADRGEIVFLGERRGKGPALTVRELFDALALAGRAGGGRHPGVSIDPRPGTLAGLAEGDLMDVVYFGGIEGTELGRVAYETDRLMKCLSLGKDNVTGRPLEVKLPKHKTELELVLLDRGVEGAWHRFWIEQETAPRTISSNGRLVLAQARLRVKTECMQAKGGTLVPAGVAASPSAEAFAGQLTSNYADYARELPDFGRLAIYAQVVAIADAWRGQAAKDPELARQLASLLDQHQTLQIETARESPAIAGEVAVPAGVGAVQVVRITGGVDLAPQSETQRGDALADTLAAEVASGRAGRKAWTVSHGRKNWQALALAPTRPQRMAQTDLTRGPVVLRRKFAQGVGEGLFGRGWTLDVPRIELAAEMAQVEGIDGRLPRLAWYEDGQGRIPLTRLQMVELPGRGRVPGYASDDGRLTLCCYKDRFVVVDGDVGFTADGGVRLEGGHRLLEFDMSDPAAPFASQFRVKRLSTEAGTVEFEYAGRALASLSTDAGERISLTYEGGRCIAATADDGSARRYYYDEQGRLQYVLDKDGASLHYLHADPEGPPVGVQADGLKPVASSDVAGPAAVSPDAVSASAVTGARLAGSLADFHLAPGPRSELREWPTDPSVLFLEVGPSGASPAAFELLHAGRPVLGEEGRITLFGPAAKGRQAVEGVLADPLASGKQTVVFIGRPDVAAQLAPEVTSLAPDVRAFVADQAAQAHKNLSGRSPANGRAQLVINTDQLESTASDALERLAGQAAARDLGVTIYEGAAETLSLPDARAGTLVLALDNCPSSHLVIDALAAKGAFAGKDVILLSCGSSGLSAKAGELIRQHGAVSVTGFTQPIPQSDLAPLAAAVLERLQRERSAPGDGLRHEHSRRQDLREILEELRRGEGASRARRIEGLEKLLYEKVGRLEAPLHALAA